MRPHYGRLVVGEHGYLLQYGREEMPDPCVHKQPVGQQLFISALPGNIARMNLIIQNFNLFDLLFHECKQNKNKEVSAMFIVTLSYEI